MGPRGEGKRNRGEEEEMAGPVVLLSSSDDDDEANRDLSLEIVEMARKKREKEERSNNKKRASLEPPAARAPAVIDLSSSSDEVEAVSEGRKWGGSGATPPAAAAVLGGSKGKRKKRKKKQKTEADEEGAVGGGSEAVKADVAVDKNGEEMEIAGSIVTETDGDISDNIVLRKLLRGPRYFDQGSSRWESCYNCGEEGHVAADCTAEKRKKPCFVCGMFGHNANKCSQGQDCFICKRRGHFAKDCPDKHRRTPTDNRICLRCGDMGHDMSSCGNAYPPDDLKKIQCYVCKGFGHFCCVDFIDTAPSEISCYNCGDSGHSGVGCAKPRGESSGIASPILCYICGEEGHFARGCTKKSKFDRQHSEPSTSTPKSKNRSTPRYSKNRKDFWGSKSLPQGFGTGSKSLPHRKVYKKKTMHYEGRRNTVAGKSRIKGGWIVDDPGDLPKSDQEWKPWKSPKTKSWTSPSTPRTPVRKSCKHYNSAGSSHQHRLH